MKMMDALYEANKETYVQLLVEMELEKRIRAEREDIIKILEDKNTDSVKREEALKNIAAFSLMADNLSSTIKNSEDSEDSSVQPEKRTITIEDVKRANKDLLNALKEVQKTTWHALVGRFNDKEDLNEFEEKIKEKIDK